MKNISEYEYEILLKGLSKLYNKNNFILLVILLISFIFPAMFWDTPFAWDEPSFQNQAVGLLQGQDIGTIEQYNVHALLYPQLVSIFYSLMPQISQEIVSHAVSSIVGVLVVLFTYLLARLMYDEKVGLLSAFIMSILPLRVLMSRLFMLDTVEALFFLITVYFLIKFSKTNNKIDFAFMFLFMDIGALFKFPGTILAMPLVLIVMVKSFGLKKGLFYTALPSILLIILVFIPTIFGGLPPSEFTGSYVVPQDKNLDWLYIYLRPFFMSLSPLIVAIIIPLLVMSNKEKSNLAVKLSFMITIFILLALNLDFLYPSSYNGPFSYNYFGSINSFYFDTLLILSLFATILIFSDNFNVRFLTLWILLIMMFYILTLSIYNPAPHMRRVLIIFPAIAILSAKGISFLIYENKKYAYIILFFIIISTVFLTFNINNTTSIIFNELKEKDKFLSSFVDSNIMMKPLLPHYYLNHSMIDFPETEYKFQNLLIGKKVDYIVYSENVYRYMYPEYIKNNDLYKNQYLSLIKKISVNTTICDPLWFRFWTELNCPEKTIETIDIFEVKK